WGEFWCGPLPRTLGERGEDDPQTVRQLEGWLGLGGEEEEAAEIGEGGWAVRGRNRPVEGGGLALLGEAEGGAVPGLAVVPPAERGARAEGALADVLDGDGAGVGCQVEADEVAGFLAGDGGGGGDGEGEGAVRALGGGDADLGELGGGETAAVEPIESRNG